MLIISLMGVLLVALGATIGGAVIPPVGAHYMDQRGFDPLVSGLYGAVAALVVWLIMWAVAIGGGDRILLSSAGAKEIKKEHAPQLWNIVEEMTIASGLGKMPRIYIVDDPAPNAFAVGHDSKHAAIAVTSGLLKRLNRDEVQGVIAHEMAHVRNLDVRFMTIAGVMVGSIVIIADVFLRSLWYGSGRRRSSSSKGGGQAQAILLVIAILLAILAPLLAQLLYLACSRKREYLADASGARFTRYPEGLASALEKISGYVGRHRSEEKKPNRVIAPMYIINPMYAHAKGGLMSTHPPTEQRIKILRSMGGNAGWAAYEAAYRQLNGEKSHCLGARTLQDTEEVAVRAPSAPAENKADAILRAREAGDLIAGLGNYLFLACACGVRIKVPPDFKHEHITCPRCGREHSIPEAEFLAPAVAAGVAAGAVRKATQPAGGEPPWTPAMKYRRKGTGWESIKCACGHTVQISPGLSSPYISCGKCNRRIDIE